MVIAVLESESRSQLDDSASSGRRNMTVDRRLQVRCRRVQTDHVEDVCEISPELEAHCFPDAEVTLQSHVNVPVPRRA